jgi:arylsulfatase
MADKKPNILVIWGDDIGQSNLSCYTRGLMGYQTPNIDRIANEGMLFTDSYGEQSCTAGRSSFITGQSVYRTGLSKVGIPAAPIGHEREARHRSLRCSRSKGYATGQFGKNHLGDLNHMLPDESRLRRILRQPVSPECRRRARDGELSDGSQVQGDVRAALA